MLTVFRSVFLVLLVPVALYIIRRRRSRRPSNVPFPPGPKGLPLLGTALQIDPSKPWSTYFEWRKLYGDLVYTRIFNMDVLIVNSVKVAHDLFESRSSIYSDRPNFATAEPYGIANGTLLMPYGDTWRLHRRIYHQALSNEASMSYRPMQRTKVRQLIVNLVEDPKRYVIHLHTYSTSIVMSVVYGYDVAPTNDPYVEYAEEGVKAISKATDAKRAALLSIFPFLVKLPTWIPGSLKAEAALARHYAAGFRGYLFDMALERMASGIGTPSMISGAVKRNELNGDLPEVTLAIRSTSAVAYGAGSETTAGSLGVFILAMVLFPEVQKKAQREIDAVVGSERLPEFSDHTSLPFVQAVLQECLRWHPVTSASVPRATTTEDVYESLYIPKGATVLLNVWGIAHDKETYPEPFEFKPERFLKEDGTLAEHEFSLGFGIGRRICPGRHLAMASMWIAVASMLASFNYLKAEDEEGNEIDISPEFKPGATSPPKPFPCRIVPRRSSDVIKQLAL